MKSGRIAVLPVLLLVAAGCRSAPPPPSPGRANSLPQGLAGQSVGVAEGAAVIGEKGGCLIGFRAALAFAQVGDDAAPKADGYAKAKDLFDRANRTEDVSEATRLFDESLSADGGRPETWNNKGLLLYFRGDVAGARKAFETAIAKDPGYRPARANLDRLTAETR